MKKLIVSLFVICGLVPLASAQLVDSTAFSVVGSTGVAASGKFDFVKTSATTGTVKLYINNLSVDRALNHTLTGHQDGILTGFAFNVSSNLSYISHSFSETGVTAIAGLAAGSEPWGIDFVNNGSYSTGGGPNNNEDFQASAFADQPAPHEGLSGGFSAVFSFGYSATTAGLFDSSFKAAGFFSDSDAKDLYLRFQSVGPCGQLSDKVYWGWTQSPTPEFDVPNTPVPEPSTYGLVGAAALCGLVLVRRKFRK